MGEIRNCLCAAAAAFAAAMCLSGTAGAQSSPPNRDAPRGALGATGATGAIGAIGAPGVVIRYEEVASSGVVYLEESGGMVSTVPAPVKAMRAPARPAVPAPAAVPAAPVAPTKVAQRRPAPSDGPGRP